MNRRTWLFLAGGLLVALLLAGVVSNFASTHPDGLDSSLRQGCTFDAADNITGGNCPAREARDHELSDGPLADYGIRGVDNPYLSTGLSGVAGVLLTFVVGGGVFWLLRPSGTATCASMFTSAGTDVPAEADAGTAAGEPSQPVSPGSRG